MAYINSYIPLYTNILYQIVPVQMWTVIGVVQYLIPVIVLLQIKVPLKSWAYLVVYPCLCTAGFPSIFSALRTAIR